MLLSELTLPAHHIENFDDFYIPFRCVSTNLVTGEGRVFDKGFLPEAMRASAGIPTVFAPVEVCLLYTSPSPRDATLSRMPSSA